MSCCRESARNCKSDDLHSHRNDAAHPETKVDPSGLLADFLGVGENLLKSVNVLSVSAVIYKRTLCAIGVLTPEQNCSTNFSCGSCDSLALVT